MSRAAELPEPIRAVPFLVGSSGISRSRTRASDLVSPGWGLRIPMVDQSSLRVRCSAWTLRLPWYAFFARETAASLLGIPLPARLTGLDTIHVGVRDGRRRPDARGLTPHHFALEPGDVVEVAGLRMTSVERTWVDLAAVLTLPELVAAGDQVLWRKRPRTTRSRLAAAVAGYRGRRGLRNLRIALELLSDRADSAPESEIRVAALAAGLPTPQVNRPVYAPDGRFVAQPDLTWKLYRTATEYEGDHHRIDKLQWYEDIRRINDLQRIRWSGIRATAADYRDPRDLIARIAVALEIGGWDGKRVRHWR